MRLIRAIVHLLNRLWRCARNFLGCSRKVHPVAGDRSLQPENPPVAAPAQIRLRPDHVAIDVFDPTPTTILGQELCLQVPENFASISEVNRAYVVNANTFALQVSAAKVNRVEGGQVEVTPVADRRDSACVSNAYQASVRGYKDVLYGLGMTFGSRPAAHVDSGRTFLS